MRSICFLIEFRYGYSSNVNRYITFYSCFVFLFFIIFELLLYIGTNEIGRLELIYFEGLIGYIQVHVLGFVQ